ncbi:MAG: hypothetical protein AAF700_06190 [Pseudomonadota bacterium]
MLQKVKNKRVAMIVPNICNLDYRVVKEAEALSACGYDVRVYCIWKPGIKLPMREELNGVTYIRREWNLVGLIKHKLFGAPFPSDTVRLKHRYREDEE